MSELGGVIPPLFLPYDNHYSCALKASLNYSGVPMSTKLLVIIASSDREKVLTALAYARNTINYSWLDDVKVMFFGPSENLLVEDEEVRLEAMNVAGTGNTVACKFLSDRDGISESIAEIGIKIEYVGTMIADLIKDGYVPMVW